MRDQVATPGEGQSAQHLRDLVGRFTLRFHDADQEQRFRAGYIARSLPQIRFSLLLGVLLYGGFGVLDTLIVPDVLAQARILRYAVICPLLLAAYGLTFAAVGRRHIVEIEAAVAVAAGVGVIWLATRNVAITPLMYGSGVSLVCIYGYTFMRLPVALAAGTMVPLAGAYLAALAVHLGGTPVVWVNEAFFTVAFNVSGLSACYAMEWHDRQSFVQRRTITERTEALQEALASVKTLSRLLPMCAWCRKVRDDQGYWDQVEGYLQRQAGTTVSHGICPECEARVMTEGIDAVPDEAREVG